MRSIEPALAYAGAHREAFLDQYMELLSIPSVSALSEHAGDVQRCAEWLAGQLAGLKMPVVEVLPTDGHPIVYAEWLDAPGKPTVLVYGHYDVQPTDPLDEWDSRPFEPVVRDDYVYARGASDMKGQIFAQFKALEALVREDAPPFNIKYLIEGEEETGSEHLGDFIDANRERLACDVVLNCDAGIYSQDQPGMTYALRGLAYFEVEVRALSKDLHSGRFGGTVRNPVHVLANLIAGMHDADGRVTLPGFYDKVREIDDEERAALAKLPYSDEEWKRMSCSKALAGEAGYTTIERVGARPALDVNGVWGGYTGEGTKTVLPAVAAAKLSMRLVADQDWRAIGDMLRAYFEQNVPEGIDWEVRELGGGAGAITDRHSVYMAAAVGALKEVFGKDTLFMREGGSIPVVGMMQEKLGVDSILLGFGLPDDGIHGPNERQYLPNFYRGIETYIHFMSEIGG